MTKEQMISHLRLMRSGVKLAINYIENKKEISDEDKEDIEIYQDQLEAFNMAMELLEQQSDDCVSRQSMLDAITEIDGNINMDIYTDEVREIVKELPPVTPTHGTCKDCKHNGTMHCKCLLSDGNLYMSYKNPDFYCADFEKAR